MKRRNFIRLSTFVAGAWLLTDAFPVSLSAKASAGSGFSPDPLLKIAKSGKITIYVMKQEMGQNIITALPLIVAEELEVDPKEITVEILPFNSSGAGNYTTWASDSIKSSWMHLRKVGATAKLMLLTAAASTWQVPVYACKAQDGKIINSMTGDIRPYQDLVQEASKLNPPEKVPLKNPKDFKLIGRPMQKTNVPAITAGIFNYTMDIKLPGMLYATIVRCPVFSGKIASWDESAVLKLDGVIKIIPVSQMKEALNRNGLAIIATNTWAALEGHRLLKVKWAYELGVVQDSPSLTDQFKTELATGLPAQVFGTDKNARFTPINHPNVYEASYEIPYMAHAAMEPMNCTASYKDGVFEIWGGFQAPMFINNLLPKLFNIDNSAITVNLMPMGGSFGRKEKIDNVADAMQLTQAMGAPIQLVYTRVDDLQNDFYRHASYQHLAAVTKPGEISQWRHQLGIATFPGKEISGPWHMGGGVTNDLVYTTSDYQSAFYPVESPIPLGSWRSIAFSPNLFAIESFIDELAFHHQTDPVVFRLSLLAADRSPDHLRLKNVLCSCAAQIGWAQKTASGRFRGIACCMYGRHSSVVAHAFEISVNKDKLVTIHRCVAAADCGLVIDPDGLKAQIEGSLVWALSGIFNNEITVSKGVVEQQSFNDYQVLRMNEMPPLEIVLIAGSAEPGGGGEPAVPSVGPALCNALFAATGERIRTLPVKKHGFHLV